VADYNSSLPVRTETAGDVDVSIYDSTGANAWSIDANNIGQVNLNDGTNSLVIGASGELTADLATGAAVQITDGTDTLAINTDGSLLIGDGTETLAINTDGSVLSQITDGTNALSITASGEITVVQASGNEIQVTDGTETLLVNTDGSVSAQLTDGTDALDINSDGSLTTQISDGTDTLAVNADGSINVVTDATPGTDVHVYGTTAAGVPGTPNSVIDRVQSGAALYIKSIQASCSGKFKVELKTGTDGSETNKAVAFGSTSSGFVQIDFPTPIEVADGDSTLLVVTNNDKSNADVYGFVNGYEV